MLYSIRMIVLLGVLAYSTYTDLKENKIKNKAILFLMFFGLISNVLFETDVSSLEMFLATLVPFIVFFPFYATHHFRAGDIKLFCAVGTVCGSEFIFYTIVYSFLVGGVFCLGVVIKERSILARIKNLWNYILHMILFRRVVVWESYSDKTLNKSVAFAGFILIGVILTVLTKRDLISINLFQNILSQK